MAPKLGPQARLIVENRAGRRRLGRGRMGAAPAGRWLHAAARLGLGARHQPGGASRRPRPMTRSRISPRSPWSGGGPIVLVVPAASPFRTAQELLAAVKAAPGRYTWATSGAGRHRPPDRRIPEDPRRRPEGRARALSRRLGGDGGAGQGRGGLFAGGAGLGRQPCAGRAVARPGGQLAAAASAVPGDPDARRGRAEGLRDHHLEHPGRRRAACRRRSPRTLSRAVARGAGRRQYRRQRLAPAGVDPARPGTPAETRAFLAAEVAKFRAIVQEVGADAGAADRARGADRRGRAGDSRRRGSPGGPCQRRRGARPSRDAPAPRPDAPAADPRPGACARRGQPRRPPEARPPVPPRRGRPSSTAPSRRCAPRPTKPAPRWSRRASARSGRRPPRPRPRCCCAAAPATWRRSCRPRRWRISTPPSPCSPTSPMPGTCAPRPMPGPATTPPRRATCRRCCGWSRATGRR